MHDDLIRDLIARLAKPEDEEVTSDVAATCWPGGTADRSDPVALRWIRQWRPARAATAMPACSCAAGHCAVCN